MVIGQTHEHFHVLRRNWHGPVSYYCDVLVSHTPTVGAYAASQKIYFLLEQDAFLRLEFQPILSESKQSVSEVTNMILETSPQDHDIVLRMLVPSSRSGPSTLGS